MVCVAVNGVVFVIDGGAVGYWIAAVRSKERKSEQKETQKTQNHKTTIVDDE